MPGFSSISQASGSTQHTHTEATQSHVKGKVGKKAVNLAQTDKQADSLLARAKAKFMRSRPQQNVGYQITIEPKKQLTAQEQSERLYQTKNIIGTTSQSGQRPTVYYRSDSGSYGRITQEHSIQANVGREPVKKNPSHSMQNENGVLVERINGQQVHRSRNPFIPVQNDVEREQLSQAHKEHTNIKDREAILRELKMTQGR